MPQSLARVLIHVVFSTKNRQPHLYDDSLRVDLYAYMATVLKNVDCPCIIINGVEDHVHILCTLSRTVAIASLVERAKKSTSSWIKQRAPEVGSFYWQGGYGAFSVSESKSEAVADYIRRQQEHHHGITYQDEFRTLCRKHRVVIDERYVWD